MKRLTSVVSASFAALAAAGFTARVSDIRIETRVDARVRSFVAAIADSLEREGVTAEPMIQYALEGTLKGANPQVILTGARKWATELRQSRKLLGPNASEDEVSAGAKAIRAGVDTRKLEMLRDARKEQRFAAFTTMSYLVSKGVSPDTASTVLINIALASASDAEIRTLQDDIDRDIAGGTAPGLATIGRATGLLDAINGRGNTDGVLPGTTLPSTRGTARPADPMANPNARGSAVGNKGDAARPPAPRGKDTKRP